jgi:signal transduction histidine kinase
VVSRTELTEHLYDQDFDRDSNTIEVFVGRLRKKLPEECIQTVRGLGYQIHGLFRRHQHALRGPVRPVRHPDRVVERAVTVNGVPLRVTITGSLDEILELVDDFRGQTLIVLLAVAVMLAIMSGIVARIALRPIGASSKAIERRARGRGENIGGGIPPRSRRVADEVNELLRSNTQIIERAKSQVGNLAHGLKTPIAVLRNEASLARDNPLSGKVVLSESDKMQQLVTTYLDRARLAARSAVVGKKADAPTSCCASRG